jgi:hypothetical protein
MNVAITLTIDELNGLLSALGQLQYSHSAHWINLLHQQAVPQIQAFNDQQAAVEDVEVTTA